MFFNPKNNIKVYKFEINFEDLISPIVKIILDFNKKENAKTFTEQISDLLNLDLLTNYVKLSDDYYEVDCIHDISKYMEAFLYEKINKLSDTNILFLNISDRYLIAPEKGDAKSQLIKWIKQADIYSELFKLFKLKNDYNLKDIFNSLLNDQFYRSNCSVESEDKIFYWIPLDFLKENYKSDFLDPSSFWICNKWKNEYKIDKDSIISEIDINDNKEKIGLAFGNYLLVFDEIFDNIKPEYATSYFWILIENVFSQKVTHSSLFEDDSKKFRQSFKNKDLALLLANLVNNLYIPDSIEIPAIYKEDLFEEVYNIIHLEEKTNHHFFTSSKKNETDAKEDHTILGLYEVEKQGSEFNLRTWINYRSDGKHSEITHNSNSKKKIDTVYALKPSYSFYYCSDFFEDYFQEILKEINVNFIPNFNLYKYKNGNPLIEIDCLVNKDDQTLFFIENKTTLNRYNLHDTLIKAENFHKIINDQFPGVNIEYMLVALYKNETVEEAYSYFINENGSSNSDFYVPMAKFRDKRLHCIVEADAETLKHKMEKILK